MFLLPNKMLGKFTFWPRLYSERPRGYSEWPRGSLILPRGTFNSTKRI